MKKKKIALLGSTGSIGTQALDVIRQHPDRFDAYVLTANNNVDLLAAQARQFRPDAVVIANEEKYDRLRDLLADMPVKVYAGAQALCEVVEAAPVDMVLAAMVGFSGLRPTVSAIRAGKAVALANKETLVVAGDVITRLAAESRVPVLPVDSEHSAIFQCIVGEGRNQIAKILLTASGGPFRTMSREQLSGVGSAEALCHPNWKMGAKITIDAATMMNKGFEMIEACWLFGVRPSDVEVVVHPESIVHSAVRFADGAVKAQLGLPDMRLPIQYALSFPERLPLEGNDGPDLFSLGRLTFERPDVDRFPCLQLAYDAAEQGGNVPCVMNAANEVANAAFREGRIAFPAIAEVIARAMQRVARVASPTLDDYFATDAEARSVAAEIMKQYLR